MKHAQKKWPTRKECATCLLPNHCYAAMHANAERFAFPSCTFLAWLMPTYAYCNVEKPRKIAMRWIGISKASCNWQQVWIHMCVEVSIYAHIIAKNQWGEGWFPLWAILKRGAKVAKGLAVQYVLAFRCIAVDSWPNWRLRISWSFSSNGLRVNLSSDSTEICMMCGRMMLYVVAACHQLALSSRSCRLTPAIWQPGLWDVLSAKPRAVCKCPAWYETGSLTKTGCVQPVNGEQWCGRWSLQLLQILSDSSHSRAAMCCPCPGMLRCNWTAPQISAPTSCDTHLSLWNSIAVWRILPYCPAPTN